MNKKPYYITTAIAYTSGKPHIGNVYEIVLTDALARYKREQGYDVFFQTGTDEHGLKNAQKADEKHVTPQQHVDEVATIIQNLFDLMNISYDKFMRTTDITHKEQVSKAFKKMFDNGDIYKSVYEGWYCVSCESFYTDSQLEEEGVCPECHGEVHKEQEEAYFFKLSEYTQKLKDYFKDHPEFIVPKLRENEMVNNFLNPGLQDLAVTRTSFDWGIHTFDEKHVIYVWLDALMNYITSLGYDVDGNHGELYKKYWPADVHVVGKDIVRFHTIYWPAFLMALDIPLPKQVFGHPWLLVGDSKMSKSKGNVVYADDLAEVFGVDAVRYIMLHEMPYDRDGHLTPEIIIERINTDLANILGNLVKRSLSMTNKYFDGYVRQTGVSTEFDADLINKANNLHRKVEEKMDQYRVQEAISEIIEVLRRCNKYIDETTPWILAKDEENHDKLNTVLYNLLESIRICAIQLRPFLPETSDKILKELNTNETSFESSFSFGHLETGIQVTDIPSTLFTRFDVQETLEKLAPKPKKQLEHKPEITIDDFDKIELRKGTIIKAQQHPNADKLLVFDVDLGDKVTQIVSGVASTYKPEDLLNKEVLVCVNLKPIKLRGVLSSGMILYASIDGKYQVVEVPNVEDGTSVS